MSWHWRYLRSDGSPVEGHVPAPVFPSQADAETWVGETWPELLNMGVDAVVLCEEGREVYGPMSLHPPRD